MIDEKLDRTSTKPAFVALKECLLKKINNGEFTPGDFLPPERDICRAYDVSRRTVTRAIGQLEKEGVVDRRPGCRPTVRHNTKISPALVNSIRHKTVAFVTAVPFTAILKDEKSCLTNVIHHVMNKLSRQGFDLIYVNVNRNANIQEKVAMLEQMSLGGLVYFQGGGFVREEIIQFIDRTTCPSVVIEGYLEGDHCYNSVDLDNFHGGYIATKYLIDQGHSNICHVMPEDDHSWVKERLNGFKKCINERNIDTNGTSYICLPNLPNSYDMRIGSAMQELIAKRWPKNVTGFFASTDSIAICIMNAAQSLGYKVPQDISIVGFNNVPIISYLGLTSVSHMTKEIGEIAADRLLRLMDDGAVEYAYQDVIKPKLVIRESVRNIKQ